MNDLILFRECPELPNIPEEMVSYAIQNKSNNPLIFREMMGFTRNDNKKKSAKISSWKCQPDSTLFKWTEENIKPWIETNLMQNFKLGVIYREVSYKEEANFYRPHFDGVRHFGLFYNIVDSGGDICFYKHKDYHVSERNDEQDSNVILNYNDITEIGRFKTPPVNRWYLLNSKVYHSIENLTGKRHNFQISITKLPGATNEQA